MRLFPFARILAPLALAACSPSGEPAAPPPEAEAPAPSPAPTVPANDPALDTAVAAVLGEDAATTRTVVRVVGEGPGRIALV